MKKILLLSLLLVGSFLRAQNGYKLELNLKNLSQEKLYLSIYGGTPSKTYVIDSVVINNKNKVVFSQTKKVLGSIYRLSYAKKGATNFVNIDVENGANLVFDIVNENLKWITAKDPLNLAYVAEQNAQIKVDRQLNLETLAKKHPTTAAGLYAKLELKEFDRPTEASQMTAYRDHYFDTIDLNDSRIKLLPNLYASLFTFIKVLPITNENYKASVDYLLKGQNCKSPNYLLYLKWVFMNLDYLSSYQLYDSYNYIFNKYLNEMDCIEKDKKLYDEILKKLQAMERIPIGSKVPELKMKTTDETPILLSNVYPEHDFTFLIIYDPDCIHCQEKIPEIRDYFKSIASTKDIKLIGFLNTKTETAWKSFIANNQMQDWINVQLDEPFDQFIKDFDNPAVPSYFLIDRQGKIILKNYNPIEMAKILK